MNIETWEGFLLYVQELLDWLYANNYVYTWRPNYLSSSKFCREKIMKDEEKFLQDLKEKNLDLQYVEYVNNCKKFLDNNIVVRNRSNNVRYQSFDFSFRFENQEKDDDYDYGSTFVWSILDWKSMPTNEWAFKVIPEVLYKLPNNKNYYELGKCWFSKETYTLEDVVNGCIKEYTTEDNIKKFIETVVKISPHKKGLPKLACVDKEDRRSSYNGPGPITHWTIGVSGFTLYPKEKEYQLLMGVESKSTRSVNLFFDDVSYVNQKLKKFYSPKKMEKVDEVLKELGLKKEEVKSITWFNKNEPTHIINNNGVVSIYCYHKGLDEEFHSLRGTHTMNKPYDPSVWGWT